MRGKGKKDLEELINIARKEIVEKWQSSQIDVNDDYTGITAEAYKDKFHMTFEEAGDHCHCPGHCHCHCRKL